jgi:NACalpha-BTF3-like transcription factor
MASSKKKLKITGVTHVITVDKKGDVIVNHPGIKKGEWKKANLTKVSGVKTVSQGVKSSKAWHKDNPHKTVKKGKKK